MIEVRSTLTGDKELNAVFRLLPSNMQAYAMQPAVAKASRTIAAAQKPLAPQATGLLQQSIGVGKIKVLPKKAMVIGSAGPRKGFVVTTKRGQSFTASKRRAEKAGDLVRSQATRYAHLTEKGHTTTGGGTVEGTHWMERGFESVAGTVQAQMQADIAAGIVKQASRLAR